MTYSDAYDEDDPKHPGFAERIREAADLFRKQRLEGVIPPWPPKHLGPIDQPNRECPECGGWELGDGTEDADFSPCTCEEEE